ncbi:hypothetical protein PHYPSEUDO_008296 [Phytophthora pseudosyringae]|uniref:Uncharacterized protein n=1 Tax=Phytophthora pseudosyringae TaxID=221518 RepID=A0A8T1VF03_9STRA|nr:hypothetical protein PHYPSEUDO_008296 [Phytophthora pseudosyringae]
MSPCRARHPASVMMYGRASTGSCPAQTCTCQALLVALGEGGAGLELDNYQNTIVGDTTTCGVSSGERTRVAAGEIEFGNQYVMMMGEISTGFDSAATFDIATTERSIAKTFRKTVVISLLPPSPEVLDRFDDVVFLSGGHVILGFKCPLRPDVADVLLDEGTDKQSQYEVNSIPSSIIPRTTASMSTSSAARASTEA